MDLTSTRVSRFFDLSSMPTLTHLDFVCGTGNSIHHCSISHNYSDFLGIGIISTVITSIVTGHKSVSVILWKLK